MPKCLGCDRRLKKWQLECRICHYKTWRAAHYALIGLTTLASVLILLLLITYATP